MKNLLLSYNLNQLITDPTHFTESSLSLIDIVICKNVGTVLTSFVSDPFIPDLIRYHCPVVVVLKFNKPKHHFLKDIFGYMIKVTMTILETLSNQRNGKLLLILMILISQQNR